MTAGGEAAREVLRFPGRDTLVRVGSGIRDDLWPCLAERFPRAFTAALVADRRVAGLWPIDLPGAGPRLLRVLAPPGEAAKTRAVLARLQDRLLDLTRDEPVVAHGGGALLDAAGFAAATTRRGLPWVAVPTTVVAMADAAVGGKVAVNHPRGKNLLGTFHAPALVLADVDHLSTLPPADRTAGLAEVYKAGRVGDPEIVDRLHRGPPSDPSAWTSLVLGAIRVKGRLVEQDPFDRGVRRLLNYGHTVGHALERALGYETLRHGEAVAVGMGVAARIARARGLLSGSACARQAEDLARLGLPTKVPRAVDRRVFLEALAEDKKRRPGATHTFVLPVAESGVVVSEDVEEDEVRRALGER